MEENRVPNGREGNNSSFSLYIYSFLVLDRMRFLFVFWGFFLKKEEFVFIARFSVHILPFAISSDSSCRHFFDSSIEFHTRTKMLTVAIKTRHLHSSDAWEKLYFTSILRKHSMKNKIYTRRITGEEKVELY